MQDGCQETVEIVDRHQPLRSFDIGRGFIRSEVAESRKGSIRTW